MTMPEEKPQSHNEENAPLIGQSLGGAKLIVAVRADDLATVYLATRPENPKSVLVRVLHPELSTSTPHLARFDRESKFSQELHEYCVRVVQQSQEDDRHFVQGIVLEGVSVEQLRCPDRPYSWPLATEIMIQTILAFSYEKPDPSTDVRGLLYSVAAASYTVLTGIRPFKGKNPQETFLNHFFQKPKPPHDLVPEIPEALSAVILRCLRKKKAERYQSFSEALEELRRVLPASPQSPL